jgi:malonyl-CoA/methylmalonyl-CoA synthetase
MIELIDRAYQQSDRRAILSDGASFTYRDVLDRSATIATWLLHDQDDLLESRVAYMISPGYDYVTVQWAIWRAGGIAVPLCTAHPLPSLQYTIEDSDASILIISREYLLILEDWAKNKGMRILCIEDVHRVPLSHKRLPDITPTRRAMILYTSGTTNLPKGVVTTHTNITAQISTLVSCWEWASSDHILCVLPLHHVHGIINIVSCALWSGATVEFLPAFSAISVFEKMLGGRINLFMAVPTIYFKLIAYWESLPAEQQTQITTHLSRFRLMVSGSAALPESIMQKWKSISGHTLLERYGMTEIGMGISNPYRGERKPGYIGLPLPGVSVRLADENNNVVPDDIPGEIQIKGGNVFHEYWRKPDATAKSFTPDGWFKTGDIGIVEQGYYKILGRDSVDIIKSGGYKISALEIEEVLRTHPTVIDCSVIGIADEEWGELVAAVLILKEKPGDTELLHQWIRTKLPAYKCPRRYKIIDELPRNAMGKVTKNELKNLF